MIFLVGDIRIDDEAMTVTRRGARVEVQPKVLDLILYLLKHRGRVVTDDELFASVWRGVSVTRASIAHSVMKARRALGDEGRSPTLIESARGRGLRFVGEVRMELPSPTPVGAARELSTPAIGSFSSETEAIVELARANTEDAFAEMLPVPMLLFPKHSTRGNPFGIKTASASSDLVANLDAVSQIEVFELGPPPFAAPDRGLTVGRARGCNVVVRASSMSKLHARFDFAGAAMTLTDLDSKNGTFARGDRLTPNRPCPVREGDDVAFGHVPASILAPRAFHALVARMR